MAGSKHPRNYDLAKALWWEGAVGIYFDGLYVWWRCEACGREGGDNWCNEWNVNHFEQSLRRKARKHRCPNR